MTRPLPADVPRRKPGRQPGPKQVYLKFFPADWRADMGVRSCSFAARGLWFDMITMMAEAEPYGHLVVNGQAPTPKQLARLLCGDEAEVAALLGELEENGVFSRTPEGVIYCRRMLRDAVKSEEARQLSERRWGREQPDEPKLRLVEGGRGVGSRNAGAPHIRNADIRDFRNAAIRDFRNADIPDSRNAYSQSPESSPPTPPKPAGSPSPRSLRDDAGARDWPLWKRQFLRPEEGTGRLICGAVYWDDAQTYVREAALLPAGWAGNWEPLAHWLNGSGENGPRTLEDITAAIGKKVARPDYEPPHSSLAFFNDVVWSYGRRGARR